MFVLHRYPDEMCNRVCNNVCAHAIAQLCYVRHFLFFFFQVVLFRVRNCLLLCCLKNEDVQIYQRRLPWNLFYKIHHKNTQLIDMNIHSSVKVIPCTIYLNLSKDTKFGSRHNEQVKGRTTEHNWSFVCEYGYFINKRQANSSTRIFHSHVQTPKRHLTFIWTITDQYYTK